jgi:hypothetical protein
VTRKTASTSVTDVADEDAVHSIHQKMIAAWNVSDAAAFIVP